MASAQRAQYAWEYDADIFSHVDENTFAPSTWQAKNQVTGQETGRGTTWFLQHHGYQLVLRHYLRGGLIGRFNKDHYLYTNLSATRSIHEHQLLKALHNQGLPVPRPVAAQVKRSGMCYQADLIIEKIPHARDLVSVLESAQPDQFFAALGAFIAQFHRARVYHADLNIKNILQDKAGKFWLIDFDRAQLDVGPGKKQNASISRLKRSFEKERQRHNVQYQDRHWSIITQAYKQALGNPANASIGRPKD